ncbi:MAG: VanZ family protein [Bacilli bacterium]
MFRNTILNIFADIWPMILIFCVIIVLMRIVYLIKTKKKIVFYKEMLALGFLIYIMCLYHTVTFQDVGWSTSNFIPFKEMFRYSFGTKMFYRNVVGNMFLFVPFGFFISYFLKLKKPLHIFILTFLTSITIELTQLGIGRVFDIDDIILNIVGSLLGFILFYIIDKIKDKLPNLFKNQLVYNVIMVLLIIVIIMYLRGLFYV